MSESEHEVGILKAEHLKLKNEIARLSQQTQHSERQLTISKSIADELDGFNPDKGETKIAVLIEGYNECFISDELMQFCLVDNNLNLCAFYLAGKALGVDLVKVVEG